VQVAEMMKSMPPEQMQEMADIAERMHSNSATGARTASGSGAAGVPPAVDPNMAAEMLKSMSPEQIASMAEAVKSSGMLPPGVEMDPEMIKVWELLLSLFIFCMMVISHTQPPTQESIASVASPSSLASPT
jgi:hypothetical protein